MANSSPTQAQPAFGIFVDPRDGNAYRTVKIGKQVWMADNLDYGASRNNGKIDVFYTLTAAKSAVPAGWRLPTPDDWKQLEQFLVSQGLSKAGIVKALKSRIGWTRGFKNGTDAYRFGGWPCGRLDQFGVRRDEGQFAAWWSDSPSNPTIWSLTSETLGFLPVNAAPGEMYSVRCVKVA